MSLVIENKDPSQLTACFQGVAIAKEIKSYHALITSGMKNSGALKKVVFDFTSSDLQLNVAGRILDMALNCSGQAKYKNIEFELHLPTEMFDDLRNSDDLPDPENNEVMVKGVKIVIIGEGSAAAGPTVLTSLLAKVREVNGEVVTISLFAEEDEVIGELRLSQFPKGKVERGGMFRYEAIVTERGKTEVTLKAVEETPVSTDEVIDLWEEMCRLIPDDEPSSQPQADGAA